MKKKFLFSFIFLLLVFFSSFSCAIVHRGGAWIEAFVSGPLKNEKFLYLAGFSNNLEDRPHYYNQYILKLALGYKLKHGSLLIGYSIPPIYEEGWDDFLGENRPWQQFSYSAGPFSFRTLFEQRFKEHGKCVEGILGKDFCGMGFRFRQKFAFNPKWSKRINPFLYNEFFFELKKTSWCNRGFSENYLFIGCVIDIFEDFSLEFGYLNDYTSKNTRPGHEGPAKMVHNISMSFTYKT